ncbi:hypothetical protein EMCRGX_G016554 [Ephydatia muelleri]
MKTLPSDTYPTEVPMLRAGVAIKDIKEAYQSHLFIHPQWIVPDAVTVPYQKTTNQDLQLPFLTYLLLRVMSLQMTPTGKCKTKAIAVFRQEETQTQV